MLYQGTGSNHSPHVPCTELVLSKALLERGYRGRRHSCEWATTLLGQAQEYTGGTRGFVSTVTPLPSALVSWAEGVGDMILDFERWLREASYREDPRVRNQAKLRDVRGSVDVFEIYASRSLRGFTIEAARAYLGDRSVREVLVEPRISLCEVLADHQGEIWITGPVRKERLPNKIAA